MQNKIKHLIFDEKKTNFEDLKKKKVIVNFVNMGTVRTVLFYLKYGILVLYSKIQKRT